MFYEGTVEQYVGFSEQKADVSRRPEENLLVLCFKADKAGGGLCTGLSVVRRFLNQGSLATPQWSLSARQEGGPS